MKLKRAWLIITVQGTNKVLLLKRSKSSRNSKQWDFIGGSSTSRRLSPRKLIRKECKEEIGLIPLRLSNRLVVVEKYSIYHYFICTISPDKLDRIKLSKEHTDFKLVNIHKLRLQRNLHHSVRIFLKY